MKRGKLLVISGPSGCGKSTVIGKMMAERENVEFSVSATTRPPRPGEREGVDYFFVSRERFEEMIRNNELLEHAETVELRHHHVENHRANFMAVSLKLS